ncbi:MAG: branched chain amino acid aminotransferase [Nonomuraea sp.]|nr:branched chain amino acid aminotransferase [Nonomuraea sp.]
MRFGNPFPEIYVDGCFVPEQEARLSVLANVVSYGTGTFEGIRAGWDSSREQLHLLEPQAHYERLARSARILGLELGPSPAELVEATAELLRRNRVRGDAYVRPLLVQAGEQLTVRMHEAGTRLMIAATPMPGNYIDQSGVRCMVSSWRRTPDGTLPNRAKVVGGYVGPALAKTEALRCGFDEAILLTADGYVAEATTSNVFLRLAGEWVTPPETDDILAGITRAQVMRLLAEEHGAATVQRRVQRSELYACEEAFLCGTAALLAPIVSVDGRALEVGATTLAVQDRLRDISRRHHEWTIPVYGGR